MFCQSISEFLSFADDKMGRSSHKIECAIPDHGGKFDLTKAGVLLLLCVGLGWSQRLVSVGYPSCNDFCEIFTQEMRAYTFILVYLLVQGCGEIFFRWQ